MKKFGYLFNWMVVLNYICFYYCYSCIDVGIFLCREDVVKIYKMYNLSGVLVENEIFFGIFIN